MTPQSYQLGLQCIQNHGFPASLPLQSSSKPPASDLSYSESTSPCLHAAPYSLLSTQTLRGSCSSPRRWMSSIPRPPAAPISLTLKAGSSQELLSSVTRVFLLLDQPGQLLPQGASYPLPGTLLPQLSKIPYRHNKVNKKKSCDKRSRKQIINT